MSSNLYMPVVLERENNSERSYDLPSRLMKDRIIIMDGEVNSNMAYILSAQIQYLDSIDVKDIYMYINSPGGSVHDGLKIADTMRMCRSDIVTICNGGSACSMGCYLLSQGTAGKRFATRSASVMAHQVSSGTQGTIINQQISLEHSKHLNNLLMSDIAERVGVTLEQLLEDTKFDMWMDARQARDYGTLGFVDGVYTGKRNSNNQFEVEFRDGTKYI